MGWSHEFSQVITADVFRSIFENRVPVNGSLEQIRNYMCFMFNASDKIDLTPDMEAFVQRNFNPVLFQDILNHSSYPNRMLIEIFSSKLLSPQHITSLKQFYMNRLHQAVQTKNSQIGFEALAILLHVNQWYKVLTVEDSAWLNQEADSLVQTNTLDFWRNPKNIDWWSDSLFLVNDSVAEPILIYAFKNGMDLGIQEFGYFHLRALELEKWSSEMRTVMARAIEADVVPENFIRQVQSHP
jgi:hypothetical protein